jgi:Mrp family chromosome partitioning ATPase
MLNFIKGSVFSRKQTEPVPDEPEKDVQVLAVWGSPASGKTTVSVRLAKYLAEQKKNVALLLCDMTAPMLPCVCPPGDLECNAPRQYPRRHPCDGPAHQAELRHP